MAQIKSAVKRAKVAEKKSMRNKSVKSEMQTAIKKFKALINANKAAEAEKALPGVISVIDGAAAKGVIHKNAASAKVSDLSRTLSDLKSGKLKIAVKVDNKERAKAKAAAAAAEKERLKAELAAKNEAKAKKEKPVKEDRKRKKAADETAETRIEKEEKLTREEKAKLKEEKKAQKRKEKEEGIV